MRDYFINQIYHKAKKDKKIILISNEQGAQALDEFRKTLPNQFINAGISEQNIISMAAGLAYQNKKVYIYSIASFITLRCFEQIKLDINLMNLPVTIFGVGSSYSYDTAGPTHHSIEDISILRTLRNFNLFSPSDNKILKKIFNYTIKSSKPSYVRLDRQVQENLYRKSFNFNDGFSIFGNKKSKVLIISTGNMVHTALNVLNNNNPNICVMDFFSFNFDKKNLLKFISKFNFIISLEEHLLQGGLGSIISELLFDNNMNKKINLTRMGINLNEAYTYKNREKIHKINKITEKDILKNINKLKNYE